MEIDEKHNPSSPNSWSELPLDLLSLVFESLSFANFQRAKTVCSSWYSASRQSVPKKNQIHWQILFPDQDNDNNSSCMLFNPEEKDKLYKTQDLGVEIAKNVCIATYGSWLLMKDPVLNIYITNLFTHERINLPPVELLWKDYELRFSSEEYRGMNIRSPRFWIDEKTKDYVVVWALRNRWIFYSKKGDNLWNKIPEISDCLDMVYKDHKLYFLNHGWLFNIFDISGETPRKTFQCVVMVETGFQPSMDTYEHRCKSWIFTDTKLVVTVAGQVLKVEKWWIRKNKSWSFRVLNRECRRPEIESLGDESMLLDQGITVLANDTNGFIRNSIYFSASNYEKRGTKDHYKNDFYIFNFKTQKTELLHTCDTFDGSILQFARARWFLPSFTHA
ncbi:putative F-box protein [Cardamine amara subsp. amara]|uniref:F-box protein n=1 Tax=Cardamine amara subsp. amara TaxID=228776 RepID=A0ABD1A523_CARAN